MLSPAQSVSPFLMLTRAASGAMPIGSPTGRRRTEVSPAAFRAL